MRQQDSAAPAFDGRLDSAVRGRRPRTEGYRGIAEPVAQVRSLPRAPTRFGPAGVTLVPARRERTAAGRPDPRFPHDHAVTPNARRERISLAFRRTRRLARLSRPTLRL